MSKLIVGYVFFRIVEAFFRYVYYRIIDNE